MDDADQSHESSLKLRVVLKNSSLSIMECVEGAEIFISRVDEQLKLFHDLYFSLLKINDYAINLRASLIVAGFLPLVSNIFAIIVLYHPDMTRKQPKFRFYLILLTLSEIYYSLFSIVFWTSDITCMILATKTLFDRHAASIAASMPAMAAASQATRNWMVAAISVARCEVVTRPLASLSNRFVTTTRVKIFAVFILLAAALISLVNNLTPSFSLRCVRVGANSNNTNTNNNTEVVRYIESTLTRAQNVLKIAFSRGLPISLVIINTCIMIIAIRCKKRQHQTQAHVQSATTTLLGFAIIFTIIEGFGLGFLLMLIFSSVISASSPAFFPLYIVDKYLLMVNSMTNVIAYVAFNEAFRDVAKSLVFRRKRETLSANQTIMSALHQT